MFPSPRKGFKAFWGRSGDLEIRKGGKLSAKDYPAEWSAVEEGSTTLGENFAVIFLGLKNAVSIREEKNCPHKGVEENRGIYRNTKKL